MTTSQRSPTPMPDPGPAPTPGPTLGRRGPRPSLPSRRSPTDAGLPLLALGEVALAVVVLATIFGLRRVFLGTEWFLPLALQAVAAHGLSALLRRRNVAMHRAIPAVIAAGFVAITWIYAGEMTTFGIPNGSSTSRLTTAASDAIGSFADVKAPTEALTGFLVAIAVVVWLGAAVADWAAFRVDATIEATLPSAALFVLAAILGADIDRILIAGLWIAAVLTFVLLRRADRLGHAAIWVGERRRAGPRTLVALGVSLALVAVVAAAIIGPRLPGARSDAVLSITDIGDSSPGTRVTVSPLVDIRSRLVDQADVEVFSVRADAGQYWRLTSLDRFDGRIWSSNGSYGKADSDLDDGVPVAAPRQVVEQSFSIQALSQIWLPAAYEPQTVQITTPVRYDEVSGTLIVDTDIPTSDNTDYRVTSAIPVLDPGALATASTEIPADVAERYLDLPGDFPDSVRQVATEVTAGTATTFDAAIALQNFFRDNFTYDLDVGTGHSEDAMEFFLLELRRGYCEQFAGTFAAMARSLGIPARVAVGFTEGNSDPADPTLFRVRGEHAHAWPEVYLGEYGWVMFEPTPGRGSAASEAYTGVPEQQVQSGGDPNTATTAVPVPVTEAAPGADAPAPTRPQQAPEDITNGDAPLDTSSPWLTRLLAIAGLVIVVVVAYLGAVVLAMMWRRRRRRAAAIHPDAKIALAWDDSLRAVAKAGTTVRAAETQAEIARRLGDRHPTLAEPLAALAHTVEQSSYAPVMATDADGDGALALADEVEQRADAMLTRGERFRKQFDPRRLRDNLTN